MIGLVSLVLGPTRAGSVICVCVHAFIVLAQGLVCVQKEHRTGQLVVDARGFSLSVAAACIRQSSMCGVPALPVTTNKRKRISAHGFQNPKFVNFDKKTI